MVDLDEVDIAEWALEKAFGGIHLPNFCWYLAVHECFICLTRQRQDNAVFQIMIRWIWCLSLLAASLTSIHISNESLNEVIFIVWHKFKAIESEPYQWPMTNLYKLMSRDYNGVYFRCSTIMWEKFTILNDDLHLKFCGLMRFEYCIGFERGSENIWIAWQNLPCIKILDWTKSKLLPCFRKEMGRKIMSIMASAWERLIINR